MPSQRIDAFQFDFTITCVVASRGVFNILKHDVETAITFKHFLDPLDAVAINAPVFDPEPSQVAQAANMAATNKYLARKQVPHRAAMLLTSYRHMCLAPTP